MPELREAQLAPDLSLSTVQGVTGAWGDAAVLGLV